MKLLSGSLSCEPLLLHLSGLSVLCPPFSVSPRCCPDSPSQCCSLKTLPRQQAGPLWGHLVFFLTLWDLCLSLLSVQSLENCCFKHSVQFFLVVSDRRVNLATLFPSWLEAAVYPVLCAQMPPTFWFKLSVVVARIRAFCHLPLLI